MNMLSVSKIKVTTSKQSADLCVVYLPHVDESSTCHIALIKPITTDVLQRKVASKFLGFLFYANLR